MNTLSKEQMAIVGINLEDCKDEVCKRMILSAQKSNPLYLFSDMSASKISNIKRFLCYVITVLPLPRFNCLASSQAYVQFRGRKF